MPQVTATTHRTIGAPPEDVLAAISDYREVRPAVLTEHYRDYRVEEGGRGAGTVAHWILQATSKRKRDQTVDVTVDGHALVERDRNSSMVTTWTVEPAGGGTTVAVDTRWNGAAGVGGFFERLFAPKGLQRIHDGVLANLEARLTGGA
ncbi:polyketide cyclase [Actinomycetospora sp. NBRC 106375]|uniref:SRPBCC family protein n=1 Tax=Actinomycetospora sp. NBRC 106375 TaxID=3032207 RepID=UPI0024A1F83A|nr:SRPBCC family protein [Actinomycetospora sp. NBRC 106375]GLZ45342.1 polyketide cyclase [Actinomycetospora sp. NBRC 106375]